MADVYLDIWGRMNKVATDLKTNREQLKQLGNESEKVNQKMQEHFNQSGNVVRKLTSYLVGMFTIGAAVSFLKKMVEVRVEWEKQTAILKTLTGSQREAESTMKMIKRISELSLSPISEISDAYIRLTNQGIRPTEKQMKQMLDVAMSSGRSFGQLAEAIFDASNQQTRGLKDFGIISKIEGNKIQLSFKGMTKEVDNTAKAISEFIFQAGDLEGVVGASEEVAKKLPGVIYDIGNAWESFMLTLGEKSTGVIITAATALKTLIQNMEKFARFDPNIMAKDNIDTFVESIKDLDKAAKFTAIDEYLNKLQLQFDLASGVEEMEDYRNAINLTQQELSNYRTEVEKGTDEATANKNAIIDLKTELDNLVKSFPGLTDEQLPDAIRKFESLRSKFKELTGAEYENTGAIKLVKDRIEALTKILPYLSEDQIPKVTRRIFDLNEQLKRLSEFKEPKLEKIKPIEIKGVVSEGFHQTIKEVEDRTKELAINTQEAAKATDETLLEIEEERKQREAAIDEEKKANKERLLNEFANTAMAITDLIAAKNQAVMEQELAAAEGNEKKQEEIRKKYARKGQTIAVSQALISGALAIMKISETWAALTPVQMALIALQVIQTAMQIATIKAQKFSKGVLDLKGSGNKDSIPAWLAPHETVMTAKETRDYMPYLKAMKEGVFPRFDLDIAKQFEKNTYNNLNYDNSKEISKLEQIRLALNKRPSDSEFLQGSQRIIKKGNVTTRINLN